MALAFIGQSAADIKKKLQRLEGLQDYTLQDLVKEAEKVYHKKETEEERQEREKREAEEREEQRDHRQTRNLTRILAVVVGERDIAGCREGKRAGCRQTGNLGNRRPRTGNGRRKPPLEKDQCACCKEKGHWARECPKRKENTHKVLNIQEDDD